ncbi:TonB-dependent receptor [Sunxiuqinia sp. sy24]|uniref:TonB-dependent receptor n=1 Tax=Sunxiuqinia sp. sy24 TaxID=3461495 RepID=UPI0040453254
MKKNRSYLWERRKIFSAKLNLIMRLTLFLMVLGVLTTSAKSYSQQTDLKLDYSKTSIREILNDIERDSHFNFVYSNTDFDVEQKVDLKIKNASIQTILDQLLDGTGMGYRMVDRVIIISSENEQEANNVTSQIAKTIRGKVADGQGEPLPGVTVIVKGTTIGSVTDFDGNYILSNVPDDATLVFSFIGMKTQEIAVAGKTSIDVTLAEEAIGLDEVVAIGYGTSTKRNLTTAVSTVDAEKLKNIPVNNITYALAGRTAGLIVTQSGGGIGKNSTISIRGGGTPLVVIDGFIVPYQDFENLSPDDVASLSVLKDASAAAVYGARAGNGVLVVNTKKGNKGLRVGYSYNTSISEPTNLGTKLSSYERAMFDNTVRSTYKLDPRWTDEELEKFKTGSDPYNYPNTDWLKEVTRNFAPESKHTVSIDGGNDINKFFISFQAYDQQSLYKENTNWLKRYNLRMSETSELKKIGLTLHFSVDGYLTNVRAPLSQYSNGYWQTWGHIQNQGPGAIAYNKDGQIYVGYDNPAAEISDESGYNYSSTKMLTGAFNADWKVYGVEGLKLKLSANYRIGESGSKAWQKTATQYDLEGNPGPTFPVSLTYGSGSNYQYTTQSGFEYEKVFNEAHSFSATALYEQTYGFGENIWLKRKNYLFLIDQIGAGPSEDMENGGGESEYGRAGYVGRMSYNYNQKYFAQGSIRYDGSDLFPEDKRWGTFFSGSLGYIISEENFWTSLKDQNIFNYFKFRASYGQVGLDSGVSRFSYLSSYQLNERGYTIDGNLVPTFSEGSLVSPDITWYSTNSSNVGFDFASLGDRLSGSVDYFYMETVGYLTSPSNVGYSDPLGVSLPQVKSEGESRRAGFDFSLSWKGNLGDLSYQLGGNMTHFNSLVAVAWNEDLAAQKDPRKREVQQTGYWGQGYINQGYYANSDDVLNSPRRDGSSDLVAGDIKYKDVNGDGFIDGSDFVRIGSNGFPRANYGIFGNFSFKGFFGNFLFQGATSRDMYLGDVLRGQSTGGYTTFYDYQLDYWTPDNRDALYPRIAPNSSINGNNNYTTSDFWLVDGKYIRLKTLQVGYELKSKLLKRVDWISKLNLVLSGQNLFTISPATKFSLDPENGSTNNYDYPVQRTYSLSVNVEF